MVKELPKLDLNKIMKIHFTGIKGVGMTALVCCALDLGIKVSGSDVRDDFITAPILKKAGIKVKRGFSSKNINQPDLLIYTSAHQGEENPEVLAAKKKGIPVLSQAKALGWLMKDKEGIVVAGVGGKTTTASILATIFSLAGSKPSWAIGVAHIPSLGRPGRFVKTSQYFIAEADEYFNSPQDPTPKFFYQQPKIAILTNIEWDHPDVYKNLQQTMTTFYQFTRQVPKNGLVLGCLDNTNIKKLFLTKKIPLVTYGFSPDSDWQIIKLKKGKFSLLHQGRKIENFFLALPGKYNLQNAAAAAIAAHWCHLSWEQIKIGLKGFRGSQRRLEFIKKIGDITLYDDYAHHPTEIKTVLEAVKQSYQPKRLMVIFQPHTYSRTKALWQEFICSFKDADITIITDIYASAREKKDPSISGELLADHLGRKQDQVFYLKDKSRVASFIKKNAQPGDLILTLGAGDIVSWQPNIVKSLKLRVKSCRKLIDKYLGKIRRDVNLGQYTSFGIGGNADYFVTVKTKTEIIKAILWAKNHQLKYYCLGGGSNTLISDRGVRGLVIQVKNASPRLVSLGLKKLKIKNYNSKFKIYCEVGLALAKLVACARENSLTGLEGLTGIPGTVGGAIVGNSGSKLAEIGQFINSVEVVNQEGKIIRLSQAQCQFSYRSSRFKKTKEIILSVTLELKKATRAIIQKRTAAALALRINQPKGKSAGSIFKNPGHKPAGWLIEQVGLKGKQIGQAIVSFQHANWIINLNKATARDVLKLTALIKKKVWEKFQVRLKEEICFLGDFNV